MESIYDFALLAFTSLFTMVNPLGVIPVYTSLTGNLSESDAKKTAVKAIITAVSVLFLFAITGNLIFKFFGISVHSLRVVGGVIFFMAGYDMLQARMITRTKESEQSVEEYTRDVSITPLAIPIICGPGAIAVSIVLFNDAQIFSHKLVLLGSILSVMGITLLALLFGTKVIQFFGESGNKVMMRIMGLIVMVISVEFLFSGLKPILRDIFMIQ